MICCRWLVSRDINDGMMAVCLVVSHVIRHVGEMEQKDVADSREQTVNDKSKRLCRN